MAIHAAPTCGPADTDAVLGSTFAATLARARGGDEAAFTAVYRDVQPILLRYLRVIVPEAADDVAAETWLQILTGLAAFRGEERAFRAWVFTIARHRAADWGRARGRRNTVPLDLAEAPARLLARDTAEIALEQMATDAVLATIATLPRDQAEIIMLRVMAGLDTSDVCRIVGKTPGAVRVAAHRGLRRLGAIAERTGVTL